MGRRERREEKKAKVKANTETEAEVKSKADFLMRLLSTFLAKRREEYFYIFYGTGANGKSTLLKIIASILGYSAVYLPRAPINTREELALLLYKCRDKNLLWLDRPEISEENLRLLTSLEDIPITIDIDTNTNTNVANNTNVTNNNNTNTNKPPTPMPRPITVRPTFHTVIETDRRLKFNDPVLLKRCIVVQFHYTIPKEARIPDFADRLLEAEKAGILNALVNELQKVTRDGRLIIPEVVRRETLDYFHDKA